MTARQGSSPRPPAGNVASNRKTFPSKSEGGASWGVDRVSAWWGVRRWSGDPSSWSVVTERSGIGSSRSCVIDGVHVSVNDPSDRLPTARVDLNPSRLVDPDGVSLCPVEEVPALVCRAIAKALAVVEAPTDMASVRLSRLDVARDFRTSSPAAVISALGPVPRRWARRNLVHADAARGGAQTLMVGSGAGVVRLYDKAAESGGRAPDGTVRWEVEARRWLSRFGGLSFLGDLAPGSVSALAADRWEWSAMGVEVACGLSEIVRRVEASGLSPALRRSFLGYLIEQASGCSSSAVPSATAAKYRALQRSLSIVVSPQVFEAGSSVTRRLDWDSGEEVLRVA